MILEKFLTCEVIINVTKAKERIEKFVRVCLYLIFFDAVIDKHFERLQWCISKVFLRGVTYPIAFHSDMAGTQVESGTVIPWESTVVV